MKKKVLVTGSAGLIGSEAVRFFCSIGRNVVGIDNNMRKYFFGEDASTEWNRQILENQFKNYAHYNIDIRNQKDIEEIFAQNQFDLIIHAAAQPSHDWAATEPITDFSINATGTLILLEAFKKHCPEAVFIFTSTNKVYGDTPNKLPLLELDSRYEIDPTHAYKHGIDETMTLDNSKHSVFGASKVAADVMVQEYGRYFNLRTTVFRGGCLTGPSHSGTQQHGFLAYLIKCIAEGVTYTIFGYKGKQVRDNIHSSDLISAFYEVYKSPRIGEVYNMGGSRFSNISMKEAIEKVEGFLGRKGAINYSEKNREGDHIWYISDVSKFKKHYPNWDYKYNVDALIEEICEMGHFSRPQIVGSSLVSEIQVGTNDQIFVSAHVTEVFGHVQALKAYLIKKFPRFVFVEHPFLYTTIPSSKASAFGNNLLLQEKSKQKPQMELFSYINNVLLTMYWFVKNGRDSKVFIGINSLNALAGLALRLLGFNFKLIYYAVDYTEHRFKSAWLNNMYHFIDRLCTRYADYVWNTSERMQKLRATFVRTPSHNLLVPSGVNLDKIVSKTGDKNVLVISEHLTELKGINFVIESLPKIIELNPQARLMIMGVGPYQEELKRNVSKFGIGDRVEFFSSASPDVYLDKLGNCGIGLAVYDEKRAKTAYYADPIAIKEYMACGLPVVVSKSLWISEEVTNKQLGIVAENFVEGLVVALHELWKNELLFKSCAENARNYVKNLAWKDVFDKAFYNTKVV